METWSKFAQPSWPTLMAVRRYTGFCWKAAGPSSSHQRMNLGCQLSSARWRRRSPARSTLFGILALMSTAVMSDPPVVEVGPRPGAEAAQRTVLAHGVGPLEDPVLPGGQPAEDLRLHGLGADEAEAGLHAGERVGTEAVALLDHEA